MKSEMRRPPTPRPAPADAPRLSYGTVDVLPLRRSAAPMDCPLGGYCFPNGFSGVCRCVVFLLVHGAVSWTIGVVLVVAVVLCALLVPLCGAGILLFRLLFRSRLVDFCAKCDAALVNYVAPEEAQIQIEPSRAALPLISPNRHNDDEQPSERLVSGLDAVSAESAMVLVYFTTIKLILATVGLCIVSVVVVLPLLLLHSLLSHKHVLVSPSFGAWQMICAYVALTLVFLVAVMSMDLIVGLCSAATRFFCCERVYALPLPRTRATASVAAATTTTARPNVVVIRLPPSATGVYAFATSSASTTTSTAAVSRGSS